LISSFLLAKEMMLVNLELIFRICSVASDEASKRLFIERPFLMARYFFRMASLVSIALHLLENVLKEIG